MFMQYSPEKENKNNPSAIAEREELAERFKQVEAQRYKKWIKETRPASNVNTQPKQGKRLFG